MKKRSEIEEKYKWDLTKFCKNDEDFYQKLEKLSSRISEFKKYENKLIDEKILFECLEKETEFENQIGILNLYAFLRLSEDNDDKTANEMSQKAEYVVSNFEKTTSFINAEIAEFSDKKLKNLISDAKFCNYDRYFEAVLKNKPHILSKKEELLLSKIYACNGNCENVFEKFMYVDLKLDDVLDGKGKKHKLNNFNYSLYLQSKDRVLRKNASKEYGEKLSKVKNTVGENYINSVKEDCVFAKIRNFDGALSRALFEEEVDKEIYYCLIKKVRDNVDILKKYLDVKSKKLGLKKLAGYDLHVSCVNKPKSKFTFEEAIDIIKKATAVLGEQYTNLIDRAVKERWIDVYANENKYDGAFSDSIYGATPVVLTNFVGDYESVYTIAHELGHAIHSYFSDENQPIQKSQYTIFVAEVASTTNEMLLNHYFINNSKTDKEKAFFVEHFLKDVYAAIFMQTLFAEFEEFSHSEYEKEKPLTMVKLCDKYSELYKFYYGNKVENTSKMRNGWISIPHFYSSFYVYKYATGLICAINISNHLLEDNSFAKQYIKFLSSGCSKDPISLLKIAGCDLTKEKTFDDSFAVCRDYIKKWEKLI